MTEPSSLISLGDLAKPVTTLIEKISDATGVWFLPHQIKRIARAEVAATIIRKEGEIQLGDLEHRALQRVAHEETQRQKNIEQVARLAFPDVASDAQPERIEADWITYFFDRARLVSDAEMHTLWGKLLAGEANKPGAFSRRTIDLVATFEKHDASLFTTLCGFTWSVGSETPLIYDSESKIYKDAGIAFDALTHLDSIGLIRFDPMGGFARAGLPKVCDTSYFGRSVRLEFNGEDASNELDAGHVLLTSAGRQLVPISGAEPNDVFFDFVCARWANSGLTVTKLAR